MNKIKQRLSAIPIVRAVILGVLIAATTTVAAQEDGDSAAAPRTRHFSVGIMAGLDRNYHIVNMSYMADMKYDKFRTGTAFGIRLGYSPWKWLSFNLGAVLLQKNYHMDHVFQYYRLYYSLPTTTTNEYINVPLEMKLSVGRTVKIHAFGGIYGGYWLKSHRKGVTYSFSNEREYTFDDDVEFNDKRDNRIDKGFTWGAGLSGKIKDRIEVGVEVRWYYGVDDIQKPYMRNLNPRYNTTITFQAVVAYWL